MDEPAHAHAPSVSHRHRHVAPTCQPPRAAAAADRSGPRAAFPFPFLPCFSSPFCLSASTFITGTACRSHQPHQCRAFSTPRQRAEEAATHLSPLVLTTLRPILAFRTAQPHDASHASPARMPRITAVPLSPTTNPSHASYKTPTASALNPSRRRQLPEQRKKRRGGGE